MKTPHAVRSASGLRGDYEGAAADYTVDQDWAAYTPEMHERWRRLYARQCAIVQRYAAPQFLSGLERLDCADEIADFGKANHILSAATGWSLVAVPGFIPEENFFEHLANRRFPVTRWLREEHELDYLVEPDVFHDFFGHVPLLLHPAFADFMQAYGQAGHRALAMGALDMLARLYWYTVEFGLIDEGDGLRAFGAGIVSSAGETVFSVDDPEVLRLRFDPVRIMRTDYVIDRFQRCYFVVDNLDALIGCITDLDLGPIYEQWRDVPPFPADQMQPGDHPYRLLLAGRNTEGDR